MTPEQLLKLTAPLTKKELFARLRDIIALGWQEMPETARYNGTGGPGCWLEDLIGLRAGNQDIADIIGWEVKYFTPQTNYITLFHKEPDSPPNIMRYMVSKHGWKDAQGRLSFRHTIAGRSDRFVVIDDAGNVVVRPVKGNGPVPIWTHDTILNAANKLKRLLLVKGERSGRKVRFMRADCFENLHLTLLISELINGTVAVDFDAREMKPGSTGLRNHGTKFRIMPDNVCRIYLKKERFS